MTVFFTADTHFGHGGARGLYRRPFPDLAAMDAALAARWNAVVQPGDTVWHLGDFALGRAASAEAAGALLAGLAGEKHLITGNNDPEAVRRLAGWVSVQPYAELRLEGTALVLCHYAFRSWRDMGRGAWNLHGHSHGRLSPQPRQADVGVDAWGFRPVTLAEILAARAPRRRRAVGEAPVPG
jgi:calcineurin-like phosphoesterase family protein